MSYSQIWYLYWNLCCGHKQSTGTAMFTSQQCRTRSSSLIRTVTVYHRITPFAILTTNHSMLITVIILGLLVIRIFKVGSLKFINLSFRASGPENQLKLIQRTL